MKLKTLFLILAFSLTTVWSLSATKVNFVTNVSAAKKQAAAEGKLYFIDFVASWCMPCRWMDETTFSDAQVSSYIAGSYIPIKVDIDDFDGFALKQQYNIKLLPSILIFDAQGNLLARYEESLPPSKMLHILQQLNTPAHRLARQPSITPGPVTGIADLLPASASSRQEQTESTASLYRPPLKPTRPATSPPTPAAGPRPAPALSSGEGLFRFSVERMPARGYSVQIGAFGEYGNVLREVAKLEEQYDQPVVVHIAQLNGKTIYKVLLGSFQDRNAAVAYQQLLKNNKLTGIIKDLSTMR